MYRAAGQRMCSVCVIQTIGHLYVLALMFGHDLPGVSQAVQQLGRICLPA